MRSSSLRRLVGRYMLLIWMIYMAQDHWIGISSYNQTEAMSGEFRCYTNKSKSDKLNNFRARLYWHRTIIDGIKGYFVWYILDHKLSHISQNIIYFFREKKEWCQFLFWVNTAWPWDKVTVKNSYKLFTAHSQHFYFEQHAVDCPSRNRIFFDIFFLSPAFYLSDNSSRFLNCHHHFTFSILTWTTSLYL